MLRRIVLIVIAVFALVQIYRPATTNPPEDPSHNLKAVALVPPDVDHILAHSCNDCHSYKTVWPWYTQIEPSRWLVVSDVNDGRSHVNFSEWTTLPTSRQQRRLSEICDEVESGDMPLKQYTWIHTETKLNQAQRDAICAWTKAEQARITEKTGVAVPPPQRGGMHAADDQKDEKNEDKK
jgi:Haem-binding domain